MGTTSSALIKHHDVEGSPPGGSNVNSTPRSNMVFSSEKRARELLVPFPMELMQLLVQESRPKTLSRRNKRFVCETVKRRCNVEDTEALAIYTLLYRVMNQDHRVQVARNMKDRGYPNEALSYLAWIMDEPSGDMESLVAEIQKIRLKRWSRPDEEFVEYRELWGTKDLAVPVQRCKESLTNLLQALSLVAPDPASKFGIRGMLDDTPNPESRTLRWPKEGNMNRAEQEKSMSLFMMSVCAKPQPRIGNIHLHPPPLSEPIFPKRLYSRTACRIPGVRFIKVKALLTLKNLESIQSLPSEAFTDIGHFAVSHGRGDKLTLERLQKVLKKVRGILPTDGVFLDSPRNETERLTSTVFVKAIFEQCHVIFLPPRDYFCRARSMMECMSWFLSPFPNQGLGDFNLGNCLILMSTSNFGKPPFFLDRPELQFFGKMAMMSTDDDLHKEFYTSLLDENRFKSTRLRESLTKLESTITV